MKIRSSNNVRSKVVRSLTLLMMLAVVACLIVILTNLSSSHTISLTNSYASKHYTIALNSTSESHHALQNSEFTLRISAISAATTSDIPYAEHATSTDVQQPLLELINPVITLQMLSMNCGTVTTVPFSSSPATYNAEAAPLMKGIWVATATFELEEASDEVIVLSYQFEVS
jgi:NAD/NADP transhydrogenase beta subunit